MAIEIVDFPINSMVIFHSYVNVYQRVPGLVNIKKTMERSTMFFLEKNSLFLNFLWPCSIAILT